MAQSGSSLRHQRKVRSASSNQKEWRRALPWLNQAWTSRLLLVIGNGASPTPLMRHGRVRMPESNAEPWWEWPGSSSNAEGIRASAAARWSNIGPRQGYRIAASSVTAGAEGASQGYACPPCRACHFASPGSSDPRAGAAARGTVLLLRLPDPHPRGRGMRGAREGWRPRRAVSHRSPHVAQEVGADS